MRRYRQPITSDNKGCFLFLLDQSFSMTEPLGGSDRRKCDELARAVNGWLHNMALRAAGDAGVRDWMDVGVIGYRTTPKAVPIIEPALTGPLAGKPLVSIVEIAEHPARIDTIVEQVRDEESGEVIEMPCDLPIWIDPQAEGSTPMCHVLHYAYGALESWIASHQDSFPPIVIHITDGESQDGDPGPYAEAVRSLSTRDGNVLLFNCHLSMASAEPALFPHREESLPAKDELAKVLFRISSELPEAFLESGRAEGFAVAPGARGMSFNADMAVLIKFLDMGTRAAMTLR